jgi:hypothetical protein
MASMAKSTEFHQKEAKETDQRAKEIHDKNVRLETGYEQIKNNVESEKIFLSYELEDLKKKYSEAEFAIR